MTLNLMLRNHLVLNLVANKLCLKSYILVIVELNGLVLSSVKHLGNYVNSDMTDKTDCDMKCSSFIGYVNKLNANFGYLLSFVLGNLFKTFCCSFYSSPLWGFKVLEKCTKNL